MNNHVKATLKAGNPSIGTWLSVPSAYLAEQLAHVGFDWLVCDSEHTPMTIETIAAMFTAMAAAPAAPMVRIPWNSPENLKRVLDAGAWGVVVPMVNSRADAEAVVAGAKYPPVGKRSVGGGRHRLSWQAQDHEAYTAAANEETLLVVQIEHITAVERADEILSVPGIDACYIGPNDLLASMGHAPARESSHGDFVRAVEHVLATARRHKVAPGIHVYSVEAVRRRIKEGFQLLGLASELELLTATVKESLKAIRA